MTICEKCWGDAYLRMLATGKPKEVCYRELLEERKDNPCPPEEEVSPLTFEIKEIAEALEEANDE